VPEAAAPRRPVPKAGPPSPQRTGGTPSRPQPVTRKRAAPPRTERIADSKRTPQQKRRDEAVVRREIREARRRYVARTGKGPSLGAVVRTMTGGATPSSRRTGRVVPGAQAQPLTNLPVLSIPQVRNQDPEITARKLAPVLTALEQTSRPVHAVAAATRAEIKQVEAEGFNPLDVKPNRANLRAARRGFELKDRSLFSDVLGDLGVKNKAVRAVGGFGLDVALDPLTYLTFGGASAASSAARSAARSAERKAWKSPAARSAAVRAGEAALARGATPREASAVARAAARKHARRAGQRAGRQAAQGRATNTGLDVRFGGYSVPGVARGTAAAKRAPGRMAGAVGLSGGRLDRAQRSVRDAARSTVAEFNPAITPTGVDREAYQAMRRAARTARARSQQADRNAALIGQSFADRVGSKNFQRVLYAIEEGTTKSLPPGLRAEAARFTQAMRKMRKAEVRAGIKVGDRTKAGDVVDYVKHLRVKEDVKPPGSRAGHVGRRKVAPDFAKKRKEGTLREKNLANPGAYSEDVGQVAAQRASQSGRSIAAAKLNQALAQAGRRLGADDDLKALPSGESVYRIEGSDLRKLDMGKAKDRNAVEAVGRSKHVVLNDAAVARTAGTVTPAGDRTTIGVAFDKAQGIWKLGATVVNPGYYVRNYAGEATNAYLKEHPVRLIANATVAARALKEVKRREEALRKGERYVPRNPALARLIDQAEDVGAIRAGQYAREVGQLLSKESAKKGLRLKGVGALRRAGRIRDNIEDQFRLASFKGGLDRGLKPEAAMQRASKTHFDYGDLTKTERTVLRRIAPFYTFSARNIPLQIRMLLQRPGKFAQYEKLRQEMAKAFGFEPGWEQRTNEFEQRGAPLPVRWKGKEFTLSLGPSGLPLTDLNELPVSANPAALASEWMSRAASMVSPAVKMPVELWANFSFFFRDQLERDTSPLVPAPRWAHAVLPKDVQELVGLTPTYYDKKTGDYTWGWRAKADYLVNQIPGPAAFANRMSKESSRSGQTGAMKTLAYFGPRIREVDAAAVTLIHLYDTRDKIETRQAILRQQNVKTGRVPKDKQGEFLELKKQARIVNAQIKALQLQTEAPQKAVPAGDGLQDEIRKRLTAPAQPEATDALKDEIRERMLAGG
jgi:hypothetical protein